MMSGDAPVEPQMTGYEGRSTLLGAKPSRPTFDPGRQVDPIARQFELTWTPVQRRSIGRDARAIAVMKTIRDLNPQAAQAVWNFMRLANPGLQLTAMVGEGNDQQAELGPAQAYLDGLMLRVGQEYGGGGDQVHNVLVLSLLTNGAVAAEAAPTDDLADVFDWFPVEPILIAFRRDPDTHALILGQQYRDGTWNPLNDEQVFFVPLDPDVEDPYGRPPILPAVAAIMAKASMLNDIRAAAHTAGFPRIDVQVMWDALTSAAPPTLKNSGSEKELAEWAEKQLTKLVSEYEKMNVDDTIVHYDWVKLAVLEQKGTSFQFDKLDEILTREVNSALKTLPILLGINETTSEAHGSVQWNIQVAAVDAVQRIVKRVFEKLANVSLQLAGFQAHAHVGYSEIRTIDRLTEAQSETFEFANLKTSIQMGWRDNEEASDIAVGHPPVADAMENAFGPTTVPAAPAAGDTTSQQQKASAKDQAKQAAWDLLRQATPLDIRMLRRRTPPAAPPPDPTIDLERGIRDAFREAAAILAEMSGDSLPDVVEAESVFALGFRRAARQIWSEFSSAPYSESFGPLVDQARHDLIEALESGVFTSGKDVTAWLNATADSVARVGREMALRVPAEAAA